MSFVHSVAELVASSKNALLDKADHWERVPLAAVAQVVNGFPFPSNGFNATTGAPVIRIRDIVPGTIGTYFKGDTESAPRLERGDLVVGMDGDFNCRLWPSESAFINQRVCKLVPDERSYSKQFLAYVLPNYLKLINDHTSAITVKHLSSRTVQEIPLPLPPRREQDRIVSRLDELFSRVKEGERALERVQKLVERYRQSVLKAAVTGELTREWRERHKGQPETGKALLTSILEARRAAWEKAELGKMKAKGIKPANDKWKQKYQEPLPPDTTRLPKLPSGWVWSSLGQLFQISIGSTPSRKEPSYWNGDIPWVSSGEVAFCRIRVTRETISSAGFENSSVKMHPPGTVLLAMVGEGKTRGQAAILDIEACHNQNAASIGVSKTPIPPEYIFEILKYRYESVRSIGQGGNQPALNADLVRSVAIPVPPLSEIAEICDLVQRKMSSIVNIESSLRSPDKLSKALRQAILREAFRGALVKQDEVDEPAGVLLGAIGSVDERKQHRKKKQAA